MKVLVATKTKEGGTALDRVVLAMLGWVVLAVLAQPASGQEEPSSPPVEDQSVATYPDWTPADSLARLYSLPADQLQAEIAESSTFGAHTERSLRAIRKILVNRDRFHRGPPHDAGLTAGGCLRVWPSHGESAYLDDDRLTTEFASFVRRPPHLFVAEVQGTEVGFMASLGMTLVTVRVIEEIARPDSSSRLPEQLVYSDRRYGIPLGDDYLCAERPGFHMPRAGDILLIAADSYQERARSPELIRATNVFPVEDSVVLPQPYQGLEFREPVSLPALERIRGGTEEVSPGGSR